MVGRWVAGSACIDQAALTTLVLGSVASCSGAKLTDVTPMPAGEITFAADSTYTISLAVDVTMRIEFPRSCLSQATSCSAVETSAFLANLIGHTGVGSIACGGDTSCSCNMIGELEFGSSSPSDSSGTYTLSQSTLSLASTTGVSDSGPYCVQGSSLHVTLSGMSSGMAIIPANLAFTKM